LYTLIGTRNCSRCQVTKTILDQKSIQYTYQLIEELSDEDADRYTKMAQESNKISFPLIIKENRMFTLQEIN